MEIKSAEFIKSSRNIGECPKPNKPEYSFIGRSNVGKSSLINMLVNKKNLAKTSSTPGKTQLINHFLVKNKSDENEWYLADLPGLGYAKSSKKNRSEWEAMIYDYLLKRKNLLNTFILIDSRHNLMDIDEKILSWFGKKQLPFVIILTKTDKLNKKNLEENISSLKTSLYKSWDELPQIIASSSTDKSGQKQILDYIEETNKLFGGL